MAEIDPVILELRAELGRYRADLAATATMAERNFARQDRAVRNLEKQMMRSSTAISGALRGLAGTLATAFTGRELVNLLDGYTRLQNALRVAGLEGEDLASVQSSLMDLSAKYGVSINGLADLYGKTAQSASDLGASQSQLLQLTEASAQALRITGTSATAAQGALLGLTQALASGIVRAEEFNQINEGGLRPLLQVAANTERFGGSVARLRAAVADGKVTSQEFYASILAGSAQLEGQASKATLTLAGAFEALHSQLIVYFGEAGAGSGATQALSDAIKALADNLDTIIPLLAVVAATIGARYVGSLVAAAVASAGLRVASIGLAASLNGVGAAGALAGRSVLAAFGGPVGAAILAVGAALYGVYWNQERVAQGSEAVRAATARVAGSSEAARRTIDALANSYGRAREEALSLARAQLRLANVEVARTGRQSLQASAEESRLRARRNSGEFGGGRGASAVDEQLDIMRQNSDAAARNYTNAVRMRDELERAINAPIRGARDAPSAPPTSSGGGGRSRGGGGGGRSGPSPDEIQDRFEREIYGLSQQILSSRRSMAASAQEEADLAMTSLELNRRQALDELESNRDYNDSQRERLRAHIERLAEVERASIERDKAVRLENEAAELADAQYNAQREELQGQYDLARSSGERQRLAMEMLDLEFRQREARLQSVIASEQTSEADKAIAQATLERLGAIRGNAVESARRSTAGPGEAYLNSLISDAGELNDALDNIAVDGLKSLNDGIADAIMGSKSLADVFKNVANQIIADLIRIAIQQAIVQPLANSLFGGKAGGGIGSFFGSLFKRASGGYTAPGQVVRVNEAATPGKVEMFRSPGGTIIPLGQVNAAPAQAAAAGGIATVRVILSDDLDGRIAQVSGNVAVEVVRTTAPAIIDAGANEAIRRAGRPAL